MASYFWRVEDEFSHVIHDTYQDRILSTSDCEATFDYDSPGERHQLRTHLRSHLDWRNRRRTPFISAFDDERAAWREARRREGMGRRGVFVHDIRVEASNGVQWRRVLLLVRELRIWLPAKVRRLAAGGGRGRLSPRGPWLLCRRYDAAQSLRRNDPLGE